MNTEVPIFLTLYLTVFPDFLHKVIRIFYINEWVYIFIRYKLYYIAAICRKWMDRYFDPIWSKVFRIWEASHFAVLSMVIILIQF